VTRVLTLMICASLSLDAPVWKVANEFASLYYEWAMLRNERVQSESRRDTLSVPEVTAWKRVKASWKKLQSDVDAEYRGR